MRKVQKIVCKIGILIFCIISIAFSPKTVYAETLASTIVSDAESYVGKLKYVYGGTSLVTGADCSGFICAIYEKYGYNLWGYRNQLRNLPSSIATGVTNNINYALPGDIITTTSSNGKHVGIYAGNGYIINAANSTQGIVKKPYTYYGSLYAITRINGVVQQYSDTTPPTISNVQVSDVNADGYTVTCTVMDNVAVNRVQFPTWTFYNGQDDLLCDWGTNSSASGTQNGTVYSFRVQASTHNYEEGWYATHIYAYDAAGNYVSAGIDAYVDRTEPVITNVRVDNVTSEGYTVYCDVTDNYGVDRVQFPTWTVNNDQDDIAWLEASSVEGITYAYRVLTSDHNNEEGWYRTHIYVYDKAGNVSCATVNEDFAAYIDKTVPVISEVEIVEQDNTGYTIECKATDDMTISKVQFPTWTETAGQDDLAAAWWENEAVKGVQNGNTWRFRVNISEHNNETGKYITHIYAFDSCKNQSQHYELSVFIEEEKDNSIEVTVPDNSSDVNNTDSETVANDKDNANNVTIKKHTTNTGTENTKAKILPVGGTIVDKTTSGKYKVTSSNQENPTVTYTGTVSKTKKSIIIPDKVTEGGVVYKVTAIADNALKNNKKLTFVEIGKNVTKIGKNVFKDSNNLKKITIKSKKLKFVGKNAFKGIYKKCKIKVPSSKVKAYKKLLKGKGQKSTVNISK